MPAGAYGDHWHAVHAGCRLVSPKCIHCQDEVKDSSCFSWGLKDFNSRVHAVLAREEGGGYFKAHKIKLPKLGFVCGRCSSYGFY